jgi:hypothetical protein
LISKTNLSLLRINFSQTNRNDVWSTLIFKCIFDGNLISELLFRKFIFLSHSSRFNSMLTLKPFICDSLNGKHSSSEYVYTERYETQVTNFGSFSLNILAKCFLQYRKCHFVCNSTIKIKFRSKNLLIYTQKQLNIN